MRTTEGMRNTEEISVTASNTLSKIDYITLEEGNYDSSTLKREWELQHFSAKQALDMATDFAAKVYCSLNGMEVKFNGTMGEEALKVFRACNLWNEDEFEVVRD